MADSYLTLAQLVTINNANLAERNISDLLDSAPLLKALAADTSPYTTHSYLKETTAPTVGFRSVNDGRENSKSADTQVDVTLKILDGSFAVDMALADAYKNGRDAFVNREALRSLRATFFKAEQQCLGGTITGSASGFTGLADALVFGGAMTVNAGGTTASTGSSVYMIRTSGDYNDVTVIAGQAGQLSIGETVATRLAGATGWYPALWTPISAWLGLQIGGAYSAGRICNLTADSGKGLTDARLYSLFALFPADKAPTHVVMNRRSREQLRASRTATNATGAPAPVPDSWEGLPIITTDAITSTEALLS